MKAKGSFPTTEPAAFARSSEVYLHLLNYLLVPHLTKVQHSWEVFFPLARGVRTDVSAYLQQVLGAGMEEQENKIMLLWLGFCLA